MAVTEIEFGQIALQMRFADMLINAVDAAFQDREETFNRVGMGLAANVFIFAVRDRFVRGEIPADGGKDRPFVRHEVALR